MLKKYLGPLLVYLLALFPVLIWLSSEKFELSILFDGLYQSLTALGKFCSLSGISLFSANLILSGRYKVLDKIFLGLDRLYRFHRFNGKIVFTLLILHPTFITLRYLQFSIEEVLKFAFDYSDVVVDFGKIAITLLTVIIAITLFTKIKYELKKKIHQFMGVALFFGGLHVFFIPSDVATNNLLRIYILALVGIALLSYLFRTVLQKWLVPKSIYIVMEIYKLNENVTEVVMQHERGEKVKNFPGQFNFWKFRQEGFPYEEHPFTITSTPHENTLRLSAKNSGDFTAQLSNLRSGTIVEIQGPYGGFTYLNANNLQQIWIAGGIGITPFISMGRDLQAKYNANPLYTKYQIDLFYSVTELGEAVYLNELNHLAVSNPAFKVHIWETQSLGRLDWSKINEKIETKGKEVFICGPEGMIKAISSQIRSASGGNEVHYELFQLL